GGQERHVVLAGPAGFGVVLLAVRVLEPADAIEIRAGLPFRSHEIEGHELARRAWSDGGAEHLSFVGVTLWNGVTRIPRSDIARAERCALLEERDFTLHAQPAVPT